MFAQKKHKPSRMTQKAIEKRGSKVGGKAIAPGPALHTKMVDGKRIPVSPRLLKDTTVAYLKLLDVLYAKPNLVWLADAIQKEDDTEKWNSLFTLAVGKPKSMLTNTLQYVANTLQQNNEYLHMTSCEYEHWLEVNYDNDNVDEYDQMGLADVPKEHSVLPHNELVSLMELAEDIGVAKVVHIALDTIELCEEEKLPKGKRTKLNTYRAQHESCYVKVDERHKLAECVGGDVIGYHAPQVDCEALRDLTVAQYGDWRTSRKLPHGLYNRLANYVFGDGVTPSQVDHDKVEAKLLSERKRIPASYEVNNLPHFVETTPNDIVAGLGLSPIETHDDVLDDSPLLGVVHNGYSVDYSMPRVQQVTGFDWTSVDALLAASIPKVEVVV